LKGRLKQRGKRGTEELRLGNISAKGKKVYWSRAKKGKWKIRGVERKRSAGWMLMRKARGVRGEEVNPSKGKQETEGKVLTGERRMILRP